MTTAAPSPPSAARHDAGSVWVLGDPATVRGFRLAGLAGAVVASGAEARAAFERLRAQGAALVIVTAPVAEALGADEALASAGVRPLVVAVPSVSGPGSAAGGADLLARQVQRALGVAIERRT